MCQIQSSNLILYKSKSKSIHLFKPFIFSDFLLGSITIGSSMFVAGSGLAQWDRAISHPMEKILEWHTLINHREQLSSSL